MVMERATRKSAGESKDYSGSSGTQNNGRKRKRKHITGKDAGSLEQGERAAVVGGLERKRRRTTVATRELHENSFPTVVAHACKERLLPVWSDFSKVGVCFGALCRFAEWFIASSIY